MFVSVVRFRFDFFFGRRSLLKYSSIPVFNKEYVTNAHNTKIAQFKQDIITQRIQKLDKFKYFQAKRRLIIVDMQERDAGSDGSLRSRVVELHGICAKLCGSGYRARSCIPALWNVS